MASSNTGWEEGPWTSRPPLLEGTPCHRQSEGDKQWGEHPLWGLWISWQEHWSFLSQGRMGQLSQASRWRMRGANQVHACRLSAAFQTSHTPSPDFSRPWGHKRVGHLLVSKALPLTTPTSELGAPAARQHLLSPRVLRVSSGPAPAGGQSCCPGPRGSHPHGCPRPKAAGG